MILQKILAAQSPWHMLVGCVLLNLTSREQADKVWPDLFNVWPDPESAARCLYVSPGTTGDRGNVRQILEPLGLGNRRFQTIMKLSQTYLEELDRVGYDLASVDLSNVFGCGQYAKDSWDIFVLGRRLDYRKIGDKKVRKYAYDQGWHVAPGNPDPFI